jgi:hypothetical protein
MIAIDNILISDAVVEQQFVCDLNKCKGGCCEDGDAGAPLEVAELPLLKESLEAAKPFMSAEGLAELQKQGEAIYDKEFGWVTPTIGSGICIYGQRDAKGIILCAFEQAHRAGLTQWKKPISCHLYPIRISESKKHTDVEYVNYEPRETLCSPACQLGQQLKMPVYIFLKEALIRKYGTEFYEALAATAENMQLQKK